MAHGEEERLMAVQPTRIELPRFLECRDRFVPVSSPVMANAERVPNKSTFGPELSRFLSQSDGTLGIASAGICGIRKFPGHLLEFDCILRLGVRNQADSLFANGVRVRTFPLPQKRLDEHTSARCHLRVEAKELTTFGLGVGPLSLE